MGENLSGMLLKFVCLVVFYLAIGVLMLVKTPVFASLSDKIIYYGIFGGLGVYVLYHAFGLIIFMIKIRKRR